MACHGCPGRCCGAGVASRSGASCGGLTSAILVVAILGVFEPQIKAAIAAALDSVTGAK